MDFEFAGDEVGAEALDSVFRRPFVEPVGDVREDGFESGGKLVGTHLEEMRITDDDGAGVGPSASLC